MLPGVGQRVKREHLRGLARSVASPSHSFPPFLDPYSNIINGPILGGQVVGSLRHYASAAFQNQIDKC